VSPILSAKLIKYPGLKIVFENLETGYRLKPMKHQDMGKVLVSPLSKMDDEWSVETQPRRYTCKR
jgi:hypothetical protein